jgi:hypothetical protein
MRQSEHNIHTGHNQVPAVSKLEDMEKKRLYVQAKR